MARHGWTGIVAAGVLVVLTFSINLLLPQGKVDPSTLEATVAILATVVTFFAVATIAVSVSLTLLSTAAETSESEVMAVLVDDSERDFLLQTIFVSFLVSLVNLCLMVVAPIHPLAALLLPALLAAGTLLLMVGYIVERVRLFDELGLVKFVERRIDARTRALSDLRQDEDGPRLKLKLQIGNDLLRIAAVVRGLITERRFSDAHEGLEMGIGRLAELIDLRSGSSSAARLPVANLRQQLGLLYPNLGRLARASGLEGTQPEYAVDDSWWLVEFGALGGFRAAVDDALQGGDLRIMRTWLAWLDSVWIQRLMPRLPRQKRAAEAHIQGHVSDPSPLDPAALVLGVLAPHVSEDFAAAADARFAFQGAHLCLKSILAATVPESGTDAAIRHSKETRARFGYLCGDLAAEGLDAGLRKEDVSVALDLLKSHVDFWWGQDDPIPSFVRPEILADYLPEDPRVGSPEGKLRASLAQHVSEMDPTWPCHDFRLCHPTPDFAGEERLRSEWAKRAMVDFRAFSADEQAALRRRAGARLASLMDDLAEGRWSGEEVVMPELPPWIDIAFVRTLMARVGCVGNKEIVPFT